MPFPKTARTPIFALSLVESHPCAQNAQEWSNRRWNPFAGRHSLSGWKPLLIVRQFTARVELVPFPKSGTNSHLCRVTYGIAPVRTERARVEQSAVKPFCGAAFPQRLEAAVDCAAVYGTSGTRALPQSGTNSHLCLVTCGIAPVRTERARVGQSAVKPICREAFPQRLEAAVDCAAAYGTSGTRALPQKGRERPSLPCHLWSPTLAHRTRKSGAIGGETLLQGGIPSATGSRC